MHDERPIVVADTVVYLQASISMTNVASSFLRRVEAGDVVLYVSLQMISEIRDVLTRPEIRVKNARLSDDALEGFIRSVEAMANLIDPLPTHFQYERDPSDEHVLNLAIEAKAQFLLSFDNDLLDLMNNGRSDRRAFRLQYPGLVILPVGEFITRLNQMQSKYKPET